MVQYFEASKTSKKMILRQLLSLCLTRWFLPTRLVAQEYISTLYLFIYLFTYSSIFVLPNDCVHS